MADSTKITQTLTDLQDFYGRKLPASAIAKWAQKIKFIDSRDLQVAVDEATSSERQFPTPEVVLRYADQARDRRVFKEKMKERDQVMSALNPEKHNSGLAKNCSEFVNMVYKFKAGSKEKYEFEIGWCQQMQKNYPHLENMFGEQEREAARRLRSLGL